MHLDFGIYGDVLAGGWPGDRRNWPCRNASDRSKNPYLSQENILIFLIFGLVLSPAIQFFFLAFCNFHDHNVRFCNEKARCPCEFSEAARFVFTYGLHMYIPYAVFNPMLFFLALHVITQEREQQRLLCRIRCYITTDNIGQTNADDAAGQHRALWWDVPPVVQALYSNFPFWTTVVMRFVLLATLETWVIKLPGEDAKRAILLTLALSVPLLVTARYTGELSLIVPFVLLDAYPLLIPSIIASTGVGKEMRHALHPLLLGLVERLFWYLSAAAMPQGTPVGIKVAVSSTFAFVYVVSALISTMFIAGKQWLLVLVISAAQIFLFEMLFNLLVLEVLVLQFFRCIVTRMKHGEPSPVAIEVTDPINISTQVRWPAMLLAVCAALPLFFVTRWDRVLPRGQCDGYVPRREHSLLAPLVSCAAAFAMACVLAAVIRLRYDRLRPPLVVHDWFLTLMWGWFIVCSVPFALTAAS
ncbi:unnamed protein product [Trypanosoma congolense IL3000]|uniref:WGS project CAEQ00000000 data, annotated contig 688 n=1 Tax=Trypanosoma congolense (strain IL3000) TaxID=1068625 RepID=F9WHR7_TRYCI|nr:unnamed protein product [Trypanosoma congolense IL3000]